MSPSLPGSDSKASKDNKTWDLEIEGRPGGLLRVKSPEGNYIEGDTTSILKASLFAAIGKVSQGKLEANWLQHAADSGHVEGTTNSDGGTRILCTVANGGELVLHSLQGQGLQLRLDLHHFLILSLREGWMSINSWNDTRSNAFREFRGNLKATGRFEI